MGRHRFHGDPARFEVLASFVADRYRRDVRYVADVAGGQGMLARVLTKKYNYECEVIDPRGWTLKGVRSQASEYRAEMAPYYDLIVGLHCDEALREVAESALVRPVLLVPCCNFWSPEKLGQEELLQAIERYYGNHNVPFRRVTFAFQGPKNVGLISAPPGHMLA